MVQAVGGVVAQVEASIAACPKGSFLPSDRGSRSCASSGAGDTPMPQVLAYLGS